MRALTKTLAVAAVVAGAGAFLLHKDTSHPKEVVGLWSRWPDAKSDGDPVRFYFFHDSGIGLYRYGQIGLNSTSSFDWRVDGEDLVLTFRKTGAVVHTKYAAKDGRLQLADDPKEPLEKGVVYAYVPPPLQTAVLDDVVGVESGKVPGRLWIDQKKFATGGSAFSLYQLRDAGIDGRGVGWHHIGDFDDWSTEALTYRSNPTELELWFTVRDEHAKTRIIHDGDNLTLVNDPRNFGHVDVYKDAGPSFGWFD